MVVANSYKLELDETTMSKLDRCCQNIEDKWNHFWYVVFDMGCHEGLGVGIYKGVEVQEVKMVNWDA